MSWFHKFIPSSITLNAFSKKEIPNGLWEKCPSCETTLYKPELDRLMRICPECGYHGILSSEKRLEHLLDQVDELIGDDIQPVDRLSFKDTKKYKDRLVQAQKQTGLTEALTVQKGWMGSIEVIIACFDFEFIGGSMGTVVGERFVRAVHRAIELSIPLICVATSGGARMQESLYSLMQMSKTAAALDRLDQRGLPYIVILASPCMGGVSASLAMLGDVLIAEPGALIGFAGPKVIEQTVRENLPSGFQKSEFLLEKGAIDTVVNRQDLKKQLIQILTHFGYSKTQERI
jgi:acetyl-CoA carboxylase carboxyl transferase subunit beta